MNLPKQQLSLPKKQQGLSTFGWMVMVLVVGSAATIGMKLAPLFLDHRTMSGVLDRMAAEPGLGSKRQYEIEAMIKKRFKVNGVRSFDLKENLVVHRGKEGIDIVMDYETRVPFFLNVDLIASFEKSVDLKN